jgi:hypothetical protein
MGVGDAAGVLVATAVGVSAVDVKTGVEVCTGVRVDVCAAVSVAEGFASLSGLHADETRIITIRVQVTFDCFLIALFSLRVPQRRLDNGFGGLKSRLNLWKSVETDLYY